MTTTTKKRWQKQLLSTSKDSDQKGTKLESGFQLLNLKLKSRLLLRPTADYQTFVSLMMPFSCLKKTCRHKKMLSPVLEMCPFNPAPQIVHCGPSILKYNCSKTENRKRPDSQFHSACSWKSRISIRQADNEKTKADMVNLNLNTISLTLSVNVRTPLNIFRHCTFQELSMLF